MSDDVFAQVVVFAWCAAMSIFFFKLGRSVQKGSFRGWWAMYSTPVVPYKFVAYGSLPWSVAFFIFAIAMLLPIVEWRQLVFGCGAVPALALSIPIIALRPRWLVPEWLQYLEDNHGDILPVLSYEAGQNVKAWVDRTQTQEGLEAWVTEVRQKHGL